MSAAPAPVPVQGAFGPDSPSTIHIAVAQILPSTDGLAGAGGLPKMAALAAYAAAQGADVIVFPEYFSGATHDEWRAVRHTGPTVAPTDVVRCSPSSQPHCPLTRWRRARGHWTRATG